MSQQINLYNPLFTKKKKPFSVRTMAQALGLIALGLAGLYIYAAVGASGAARLAAQFSEQLNVQCGQLARRRVQRGLAGRASGRDDGLQIATGGGRSGRAARRPAASVMMPRPCSRTRRCRRSKARWVWA